MRRSPVEAKVGGLCPPNGGRDGAALRVFDLV